MANDTKIETPKKTCGIIMPISPHPEYPAEHWKDVLGILTEAIFQTEFEPKLVSDDVAIGLIHDRIVTNIYHNEIVVCDVSSKNPNVMFELGLRLAFDKPTIIVKDENTGYSFDTGVIEHITYPSSLRFSQIVKFKEELAKRITATYKKATTETNFSPFLKSFGKTIIPALINQTEIPEGKYILSELDALRQELRMMRVENKSSSILDYRFRKTDSERSIINSVLSRYSIKPDIKEVALTGKFVSSIRNELRENGVEMGTGELIDYLSNYFKTKVVPT